MKELSIIESLTVKNATHNLLCVHQVNNINRVEYYMPCIVLKKMPYKTTVKVLVFGDRRSKDYTKKRIRYVPKVKLVKIADVTQK